MNDRETVKEILTRLEIDNDERDRTLERIMNIPKNIYKYTPNSYFDDIPMLKMGLPYITKKGGRVNKRIIEDIDLVENLTLNDYNNIKNKDIWDNLLIDFKSRGKTKKKYNNLNDYLIENVKTEYKCPICKNPLIPRSEQTRASDEPETVRYVCDDNPDHKFTPEEIELKK